MRPLGLARAILTHHPFRIAGGARGPCMPMGRTIPGAQLSVVPRAGHGVMPREAILTFLKEEPACEKWPVLGDMRAASSLNSGAYRWILNSFLLCLNHRAGLLAKPAQAQVDDRGTKNGGIQG